MEQTLWVERLSLRVVIISVIKKFFCNINVYYDEHNISSFAAYALSLLKNVPAGGVFFKSRLSLDKRASGGLTLNYEIQKSLNACINAFIGKYAADETKRYKNMIGCYISNSLARRVSFATAAETEAACLKENKGKYILYFEGHPLNELIIPFYSEKGFDVKESVCIGGYAKLFIRPFFHAAVVLFSKILGLRPKSDILRIVPSVWVECAHSRDMVDLTFWMRAVRAENFDIVCYLDRPDTQPTDEVTGAIRSRGLKWIDMHRLVPFAKDIDINLPVIRAFLSMLVAMVFKRPVWYGGFKFQYAFWLLFYKSVYERFMVKVLIQHQDSSWMQEVQARAIEAAGGIMIGFHWSIYPRIMSPTHLFPFHVFFVWGGLIRDCVRKSGGTCCYMLPSGFWLQADAQQYDLPGILPHKLDFILAVFDSSAAYNTHQTPESLSQFYGRILFLLEHNASWGAIIKSKNWDIEDHAFPLPEEVISRMKVLIEQKRLAVLDAQVSPAVASSLADLAVCYGLNSAGIIAGIHGHKAVHWDCSGWQEHPFYKDAEQRFIFDRLDDFEHAIVQSSKGDASVGDFSKWRQSLNYFEDYNASERVGKFIQTFMADVSKKTEMRCSLAHAVDEYCKENEIAEESFSSPAGPGNNKEVRIKENHEIHYRI